MKKVLIVGGGISGLTSAYWLLKSGIDVTLLEKEKRAGGAIRTEKEGGYLIECGPNSTLDIYKEVDDLCEDLGIMKEKIYGDSAAGNRYVVRNGSLRPLPTGPLQLLTTDLWSIGGKLRLLGEPFIPKYSGASEETISQFVARRTGQEFLDYAIDPFVTGVFAGDPGRLSLKSCFPKMYALEQKYGSLIKGALLGRRKGEGQKRKMRLFTFRDGLETVPAAISKALDKRFIGGCSVNSVKRGKDGFEITAERDGNTEVFRADVVLLATPAWVTASIMNQISETAASYLTQIEYVPVSLVFTGFDRRNIRRRLDGFGFLIPSREANERGCKVLGSIWSSSIFPGRAPLGKVLFTNILGGARKRDILEYSDSELVDMTLRDLMAILGIDEKPGFVHVIRQPRAIPQYGIGHEERIQQIESALKDIPGLHLAGNYINGVSVGHCIAEASKLAARLSSHTQAPPP